MCASVEDQDSGPACKKAKLSLPARDWPFLQGWINGYADPLPDAILEKCKPLFCDLCSVKMNSAPQAKLHYDGKVHEKRARHFLAAWSQENLQSMPRKKERTRSGGESPGVGCAEELFCPECKLSFTSRISLHQHQNGRNHKRKVAGQAPLNSGYFNKDTNKWERNPPAVADNPNLKIISPNSNVPSALCIDRSKGFFCDLCRIGATSQPQLDMHLQGKSHKKMLAKATGLGITSMSRTTAQATIVREKLKADPSKRDYSVFRTPSGQYYCSSCNICVNSEHQFTQHIESKKHKTCGTTKR